MYSAEVLRTAVTLPVLSAKQQVDYTTFGPINLLTTFSSIRIIPLFFDVFFDR